MTIRAMRRRIQRAGWSAMERRGQFPKDYADKRQSVGHKTAVRGAAGKSNPAYWVMRDGSIRRADR